MMFKYALIVFLFLFNLSAYGEETQRSLKQQLDRLQRDVNDLSKLVYKKNTHDNENENKVDPENSINISAFDMRIYDLEKDIKTLNSNFEEVVFQIDELQKLYGELNIKIDTHLINKIIETETSEISSSKEIDDNSVSENTLGTLTINSEDLSDSTEENQSDNQILDLSPDEQFQIAFDLLRSQQYDQAKKAFEEFIENNIENQLAGSSYYFIGKISLYKKEYREAALIFAEGYQEYPTSIKAPDNLYNLAETLSQINKINDACNTLNKFIKEYINHKLINKAKSMIIELECD